MSSSSFFVLFYSLSSGLKQSLLKNNNSPGALEFTWSAIDWYVPLHSPLIISYNSFSLVLLSSWFVTVLPAVVINQLTISLNKSVFNLFIGFIVCLLLRRLFICCPLSLSIQSLALLVSYLLTYIILTLSLIIFYPFHVKMKLCFLFLSLSSPWSRFGCVFIRWLLKLHIEQI